MIQYQGRGEDDIGRPIVFTARYRTRQAAQRASIRLARSPRVCSITVVRFSGLRTNPEAVATATVAETPAAVPAASAPVKTNPRISLRQWIKENRQEIDQCIRRVVPNARIDDDERRMWILNDEGMYRWARSEGVNV